MDRAILVSADLAGTPQPVGRLWARTRKGTETATFEYDHRWLGSRDAFSLEPALTLGPGPHHTPTGKALFGAIGDSAPDRWGRLLMRRGERRRVVHQRLRVAQVFRRHQKELRLGRAARAHQVDQFGDGTDAAHIFDFGFWIFEF